MSGGMLPTPRRIRATRRWALTMALVIALPLTVISAVAIPGWWMSLAAVLIGTGCAAGIYRHETAIVRSRLAVIRRPFPEAWHRILSASVRYYSSLDESERERFQQLIAVFLSEKPIIGIGCVVDDTSRLLVAASAVIPIYAFPAWEYDMLRKVLIRPEAFDPAFDSSVTSPVAAEGMIGSAGLFNGVMIISQPALLAGFAHPGLKHNVGIHEFAHLIDFAKGHLDGIPSTLPRECLRPWTTLVHEELSHAASHHTGMPDYGYTSETEFFAVASEYFFEAPEEMAVRDPRLYGLLERAFGQDMSGRSKRMSWQSRVSSDPASGLAIP
jgi:Mlc titration factor MtfA (ptsG expression regulator)